MQKYINVVFIVILIVIATITPLNTALLHLNIFAPVIDTDEQRPTSDAPAEIVSFIGIGNYKLSGSPETPFEASHDYWTHTESFHHFLDLFEAEESSPSKTEITLLYASNNGEFKAAFPAVTAFADGREFSVLPSPAETEIIDGLATYRVDLLGFLADAKDGYHKIVLSVNAREIGYFVIGKNTEITKTLLPYRTDLPDHTKEVRLYFPDKSDSVLVPISRNVPSAFEDYVALYRALQKGPDKSLGLKEEPAVAYSHYYWISNGGIRLDFHSRNLKDRKKEMTYRSMAYTFASLGGLKKTDVYVDGVLSESFDIPSPPYCYSLFESDTEHLYILEKESGAATASEHISDFITKMQEDGILPPVTKLVNCELAEEGRLDIRLKLYEYCRNDEIFKVLLNLTAYSLPGITKVVFNGEELPKIHAFNLESR